jgi:sugar/nucleoside kinase (ribokinase family)
MKKFDVVLVGEFNLDLVFYGLPETLPPEHELLASDMALLLGGSTAITAHNLACLGNRVGLIAPTANDLLAGFCTRELEHGGVDLSRAVAAPRGLRTGVSVHLQHEALRRSFTYAGSTACLRFEDLDLDYLRNARHFHLSSFFLQRALIDDVPRLLGRMKEAGLSTSLDTNDDPTATWAGPIAESLKHVDILMPNEREAMALSGEDSVELAIRSLAHLVPVLVVKRGSQGAVVLDHGRRLEQPAFSVSLVDAVGAGDSFNAGFLHGYLNSWPMERCLLSGNLAGAYSTTQMGGVAAFREKRLMEEFFDIRAPGLFSHA